MLAPRATVGLIVRDRVNTRVSVRTAYFRCSATTTRRAARGRRTAPHLGCASGRRPEASPRDLPLTFEPETIFMRSHVGYLCDGGSVVAVLARAVPVERFYLRVPTPQHFASTRAVRS